MTSNIDVTKPKEGSATTSSVRDNFSAARSEILSLQEGRLPSVSGNGLLAVIAGSKAIARTLRGTTEAISVSNQQGTSGDPTVNLADTLSFSARTLLFADDQINGDKIDNGSISNVRMVSTFDVSPTASFGGDVVIAGNLSVAGDFSISGTVIFSESLDLGGTLDVSASTSLNSTLVVTGASDLNSTLDVSGSASIGGNLVVAGSMSLTNTATLQSAVKINGTLALSSGTAVNAISNDVEFTDMDDQTLVTENAAGTYAQEQAIVYGIIMG